jgi:hypothetical protein
MASVSSYIPKVGFGLGSAATGLSGLATGVAAVYAGYEHNIVAPGTVTLAGISAVALIAFHYVRGSQAGKLIENSVYYKHFELDLDTHLAGLNKVGAEVDKVAPALAPVIAKLEAIAADIAPSTAPPAVAAVPVPVVVAVPVAAPAPPAAPVA